MFHSLKRNIAATNNDSKSKVMKITSEKVSEIFNPPVKSLSDKKEYRLIKLNNGLTSLLIQHFIEDGSSNEDDNQLEQKVSLSESDISVDSQHTVDGSDNKDEEEEEDEELDDEDSHKEKMAAVALCIRVGSFFDPTHIQGLSHFLEHMIFMGSEKYPKENEFDQYISNHGGADNAMTECEYTMFYFEIVEEQLANAIDRFAQLFVSPLMLRDSMEREMEAVESEFQNSIADDDTRIMQLFASIANGPASTFVWGNLKTLKEGINSDELYTAVHEFRRKYYLANRMYLCIESSLPLDDQQRLAEENFSSIQSGPEPEPLKAPESFFKPEFYEKIYYVKPKADKSKLFMTFLLPSLERHYKSKPHDYLAYIIEHEGVGSLSSYLKKRLLAVKIEAGVEDQSYEGNSMFTLFSINVTLTEKGIKNIETVLEAIFSFLLVLKVTPIAEHEKAYLELKQIKDTSFKYREERMSTDNVEEFAVNLMYYDANDILTGSDVFFNFDGALVQDLILRLNERKFNLLILTDKHEKYEKTEKWFGTEYDEVDVPERYINLWNNRQLNIELSMPPKNGFICNKFEIFSHYNDSSEISRYPEKIIDNNYVECFYKLDTTFKLPHAFICLHLVSPKTCSSVHQMMLTSLYSMIVKHYMVEKLYPAVVAGLGYQLVSAEKGMLLKLSGYNEKLPLLLDIITKELKMIGDLMEPEVFETYRKQYKKYCYNNLINSKFFNKDCRLSIVEEDYKFFFDRYMAAEEITFEQLKQFSIVFLDQLKLQILVQGNIERTTAIETTDIILKNLNCSEIDKNFKFDSRARKIPIGSNVLQVKSILPNDKNSTTTNYIQIGPSSIRLQCLIEFIEKIMEEPLFDILRTHEQLGYSVGCSHRMNHGILGLSVTIQSQQDKNTTTFVDSRIEKFLNENIAQSLKKMSDEEFVTFQTALIKLKNMVEVELESEVNRHWGEIVSREYIFNRLELEAQMIAQLTKKDVVDFFNTEVISSDARKLSIQVIGNEAKEDILVDENHIPSLQILSCEGLSEGQRAINDIFSFKKNLELYPITKTVIDL